MVPWSEPEHTGDAAPESEKATCFHLLCVKRKMGFRQFWVVL